MKKLLAFIVFILIVFYQGYSQTFETFIEDTATYYYRPKNNIILENNSYNFFLLKSKRDSIYYYGNINYINLDSVGNIITDTILFPEMKLNHFRIIKSSNNNYYIMTSHSNKTDSLNGRIFKLDSAFNIISYKNLPYFYDSLLYANNIVEVENNNIIILFSQDHPSGWYTETFLYKMNENLDSIHCKSVKQSLYALNIDTVNMYYVSSTYGPDDTLFMYFNYDLSIDTTYEEPTYLPQFLCHCQSSLLLLKNGKKIYSTTSVHPEYYMGIYLFNENAQVLNHHMIDFVLSYPGEVENLCFVENSPDLYYIGCTGYWSPPGDTNSLILSKLDTNLNIDFIKYYYNERILKPWFIKSTKDGGCIVLGTYGYEGHAGAPYGTKCIFVAKFDSLGTVVWTKGIELEEKIALVYPNPVQNTLFVQNSLIKHKVIFSLFDIGGKQVFTKELQPQENSFDISALSAGVYIYIISDKEKTMQTGKIVKD